MIKFFSGVYHPKDIRDEKVSLANTRILFADAFFVCFKDVPGGFPKSNLLGVTVALIHVAAQRFFGSMKSHIFGSSTQKLVVLTPEQYNKVVLCQLQRQLALWS